MNCNTCGKPTFVDINCDDSTNAGIDLEDVSCTVTTSVCVCNSCAGCYFCGCLCVKEIDYNGNTLHLCASHKDAIKGNLSDYTWPNDAGFIIPGHTCNCPLTGPCICNQVMKL